MTHKVRQVFIITRREFSKNENSKMIGNGLGYTDFSKFDESKVLPTTNISNLFKFWIDTLINEDVINFILSGFQIREQTKKLYDLFENEDFREKFNTYFEISEADIAEVDDIYYFEFYGDKGYIKIKPNCFSEILEYYKNIYSFETEYVKNIIKPKEDIYVYHHWLDKQGLKSNNRNRFLLELRVAVVKDLNIQEDTAVSINWLIHDSDLGLNGTDGLIKFGEKVINENNPEFYNKSDLYNLNPDLLNDNFWIFTHTTGQNGIYDKYILKDDEYKNADELYNLLVFDKDRIRSYIEIFEKIGLLDFPTEIDISDPIFEKFISLYERPLAAGFIQSPRVEELTNKKNFIELKNQL